MSRTLRARSACALALTLLGAGCQSYNFNPVGHCLIQPGTKRVTLSNISSADVLFVVDDSGSMAPSQQALANNFSRFIANLSSSNAARAAAGLEPFDFHIAVTTTSVFWNYTTSNVCRSTCTGAAGQLVCCKPDGTPARQPKACTPGVTACPGPPSVAVQTTCGPNCVGLKGENYCCNQTDGSFPLPAVPGTIGSITEVIPCSTEGNTCGTLETHFDFGTCTGTGVSADQWAYPAGDFVSWSGGSAVNPRVLHFDKELYTGGANKQGFTSTQLVNFFKGIDTAGTQGNVTVGTCGSGEEQALQAARLAIQKAQAGQQKDTYARTSMTPTWTAATRTAGSDADWLKSSNSKLVVVFAGDEDDCSSPKDPSAGVVMLAEPPGADACAHDATDDPPLGHKEYPVDELADFFMGLGRPFGAAFILPAHQSACTADTCTASAGPPQEAVCSPAQALGIRLLAEANALRTRGADVVVGSICDTNFGAILDSIAELVKPPAGLTLPSLPAADEVTVLRIATPDGQTRKVCGRPLAPGSYPDLATAQATGADWWFTAVPDVTSSAGAWNPVLVSQNVYINPTGSCIANPGETYSADYLGRVPSGGCWNDASYTPQGSETSGDAMCRTILGGQADTWTCYAGVDSAQACVAPTQASPGTCICGTVAANCPGGRLP